MERLWISNKFFLYRFSKVISSPACARVTSNVMNYLDQHDSSTFHIDATHPFAYFAQTFLNSRFDNLEN